MPIFLCFCKKMLKSMRSNAFGKSNVQIRRQAKVPGVSIGSYHLLNIYINATVELNPLSPPNWSLSFSQL